jgi:TRAP-type uncharacterized transport system substrate-binding protein
VTAAAIACAAIVMLRSMPPHVIVMATGPEGDAAYEIGKRYRAVLARANVEVQLVPTRIGGQSRHAARSTFGSERRSDRGRHQ